MSTREITVTTKVEVPEPFTDDASMGNIRMMLTHGITDEVNAFFEDENPGVHVTSCDTAVSR